MTFDHYLLCFKCNQLDLFTEVYHICICSMQHTLYSLNTVFERKLCFLNRLNLYFGAQKNPPNETVLLSTHNICFLAVFNLGNF